MPHMHEPAIDLRSDTVTRPTAAMREAMAVAPVGDDQYGEDPTANELQRRVAGLLGKESALWLPSGTMANQIALRVLTRPGDDVVVSPESHAVWHETGAGAANAGVQFTEVGARGVFTAEAFVAACKPRSHVIYPPTTLVEIENTHNRAGGVILTARDCGTRRSRAAAPSPSSPHPSTWSLSRCPRDWARRAARCSRDRGRSSNGRSAIGGWRAARCARSASSRRPASMRWTGTWTGWPRITPTRG